jgi:hypothetical protein
MKLMVINPETKLPEPTAECLTIPAFNTVWTRIVPIDGDRKGEQKKRNLQEFGYIYFHSVWDSRFRFFEDNEKDQKIRELMKLPPNWQPDENVKEGIKIYSDIQSCPAREIYDSANGLAQDLSIWVKEKRKAIRAGTASPKDVSEIQSIAESVPGTIQKIKEAKEVLEIEEDKILKGKKGRALNYLEMPRQKAKV